MKTFLSDLINNIKRKSESLDVKSFLCNKTWRVFSDTNEKEVYIFMEDGKLIISINGVVVIGTWMYISANQSLVISGNNQNYLVHPLIYNDLMVLNVDGTNQCGFLLDNTKKELESINTLEEIEHLLDSLPIIENCAQNKCLQTSNEITEKITDEIPKYLFGENGEHDGKYLILDMRQVVRNGNDIFDSMYYFKNLLINDAYVYCSIDKKFYCKIGSGQFSFLRYEVDEFNFFDWTFYDIDNFGDSLKSILGLLGNKRMEKERYSLECYVKSRGENFTDNIPPKNWMAWYGKMFVQDLFKCRTELTSFLGFDPIEKRYWDFSKDGEINLKCFKDLK